MFIKAFATGGRYYTNAAGQRTRYTATSRQGRFYERTGGTMLTQQAQRTGTPSRIRVATGQNTRSRVG